jgi:hypothetical protein
VELSALRQRKRWLLQGLPTTSVLALLLSPLTGLKPLKRFPGSVGEGSNYLAVFLCMM